VNLPGLKFGATNTDRVQLGTASAGTPLNGLDPWTFLCWCYPTTLTNGKALLATGFSNGTRKRVLVNGTTGNLQVVQDRNANANSSNYVTSDTPIATLNRWYFVAATGQSASNPAHAIYVGTAEKPCVESAYGTATNGSGAFDVETDGQFTLGNLGNSPTASTSAWLGSIGVVAMLNQTLKLAELRQWQKWTLDPSWRPGRRWATRLYMRLGQQGSGSQVDLSAYGSTGTVTGATPAPGPTARPKARRGAGSVISAAAPDTWPAYQRPQWYYESVEEEVWQ
jgi:hypothetical protein